VRKYIFLFAAITYSSPFNQANAANSVDVNSIDIAGVKTGMGFEEARVNLARYYNIAPDTLIIGKPVNDPVGKPDLPTSVEYRKGGIVVRVGFVKRVPEDSRRPLVVNQITYRLPFSKDNSEQMSKLAIEEYGEPSNALNDLPMQWCENPDPKDTLSACRNKNALIMLSGTTLTLYDLKWSHAVGKHRQKGATYNN